jgi:hypothetical protein
VVDADVEIREVEADQAEAVLALRLFVPGVAGAHADRYFLARSPRPAEWTVESVTVEPDGTVTERGTLVSAARDVIHCLIADGRTADGRGCGSHTTVAIDGRSAAEVGVRLSVSWTAGDGSRGELETELVVPWLGAARRELAGGAWVAAEITPAAHAAEPQSAPDAGRDTG